MISTDFCHIAWLVLEQCNHKATYKTDMSNFKNSSQFSDSTDTGNGHQVAQSQSMYFTTCSAVSLNLFIRRPGCRVYHCFCLTAFQKGPICIYIASWFAYISPSSCLAIGSPTICTNRLPVFSELVKFQMELFTSQCCRVEALFPSSISPQYQSSRTRIASTRSVFWYIYVGKRPPEYTKFATYFL